MANEALAVAIRRDAAEYLLAAGASSIAPGPRPRRSWRRAQGKRTPGRGRGGRGVRPGQPQERRRRLREGIGVVLNAGALPNFAEYDVGLPRAGLYQLELRLAAAESRPVRLRINGQPAGQ
jgi:hypothetical protein